MTCGRHVPEADADEALVWNLTWCLTTTEINKTLRKHHRTQLTGIKSWHVTIWCFLFFSPQVIQINFEEFDLEIGYDSLTIGDGGEVGDSRTIIQV